MVDRLYFLPLVCFLGLVLVGIGHAAPQGQTVPTPQTPPVVRLGPTVVGLGPVRVDTAARELRVPGRINAATTLEFVANTPRGLKEYESAITVSVNAATFNAALLLLGLDPQRARVPTRHFDPTPPTGDPVEVIVEWQGSAGIRQVKAEELLWNQVTKTTMPAGKWVYTGSSFSGGEFLADSDGVLIGFVHSPAPLIENSGAIPAKNYGDIVFNPKLGLAARTPVTLIVRALARKDKTGR